MCFLLDLMYAGISICLLSTFVADKICCAFLKYFAGVGDLSTESYWKNVFNYWPSSCDLTLKKNCKMLHANFWTKVQIPCSFFLMQHNIKLAPQACHIKEKMRENAYMQYWDFNPCKVKCSIFTPFSRDTKEAQSCWDSNMNQGQLTHSQLQLDLTGTPVKAENWVLNSNGRASRPDGLSSTSQCW